MRSGRRKRSRSPRRTLPEWLDLPMEDQDLVSSFTKGEVR